MPRVLRPWHAPRAAIERDTIGQAIDHRDLKALAAIVFVIIKHAQQAQTLLVERTSESDRMDGTVDDKEGDTSGLGDLVTIGDNNLRYMHIGGMIGDKESLALFVMGDQRLRASHDASEHGDFALGHCQSAPIRDTHPMAVVNPRRAWV